jgi:hypothetical protein
MLATNTEGARRTWNIDLMVNFAHRTRNTSKIHAKNKNPGVPLLWHESCTMHDLCQQTFVALNTRSAATYRRCKIRATHHMWYHSDLRRTPPMVTGLVTSTTDRVHKRVTLTTLWSPVDNSAAVT